MWGSDSPGLRDLLGIPMWLLWACGVEMPFLRVCSVRSQMPWAGEARGL